MSTERRPKHRIRHSFVSLFLGALVLCVSLTANAHSPSTMDLASSAPLRNAPPGGWVDLFTHVPELQFDIRYHTQNNFTEHPLPGYLAPGAWMIEAAGDALKSVHGDLKKRGFGLLVYDAYRPQRGTLAMVAWAERTGQTHLLDQGYIARRSNHNRGIAIDLTLVGLSTGEIVDMGTPWDTLSKASHTYNGSGDVLKNRLLLKDAMEAHGFSYYSKEWWHFVYKVEPRPPLKDTPYACSEPEEGAWSPPPNWNVPGVTLPSISKAVPCKGEANSQNTVAE